MESRTEKELNPANPARGSQVSPTREGSELFNKSASRSPGTFPTDSFKQAQVSPFPSKAVFFFLSHLCLRILCLISYTNRISPNGKMCLRQDLCSVFQLNVKALVIRIKKVKLYLMGTILKASTF